MPELPEVETIRCQLEKQIKNKSITDVIVRKKQLRWPIPKDLKQKLINKTISSITRRGKYLILNTVGARRAVPVHIHLGMSGNIQIIPKNHPIKKHDHVDIIFDDSNCLRFNDPRRFGAILLDGHKLLDNLGPEPLTDEFNAEYLFQRSRKWVTAHSPSSRGAFMSSRGLTAGSRFPACAGNDSKRLRKRKIFVKQFIMDGHIVAGIGNIYANEALFSAGIDPRTPAGKIPQQKYKKLVTSIKQVLALAIKCNGTTFRDFVSSNGQAGSFKTKLKVYGREGLPCLKCKTSIKKITLGQRSTFFCPQCQIPA